MDAVMFETKATHLALQRVGRRMLRGFGITPARFDLLNAVGLTGLRQSDLWKRLNVVRSAVSEMVRALEGLGWVKRVRATDTRTWLVQLTRCGREILSRAFDACVESGDAAVWMDYGLAQTHIESNAQDNRELYLWCCTRLGDVFRTMPWYHGASLYCCDPEEYYHWLVEPGEPLYGSMRYAE